MSNTIFTSKIAKVAASLVNRAPWRLDAQYHTTTSRHVELQEHSSALLSECCTELYEVPLFHHIYIAAAHGIPFYTSSALFQSDFTPSHYLTPLTKNLETYRIKAGQILLARSGDVSSGIMGCVAIAGEKLDRATTSDHVIRIVPDSSVIPPGYLCAFLMSPYGRQLMVRNASGSVIPAIRPDSLKTLPIPRLTQATEQKIDNLIFDAVRRREQATDIQLDAWAQMLRVNELAPFPQNTGTAPEIIITRSNQIHSENAASCEYRLDAHFYNPTAQLAVANIRRCTNEVKTVGDVVRQVLMGPRFKRNYVESTHGVPFLSGKNIVQIRPIDLKYLSNLQMADMKELLVQQEWTLITCSGTIGRTCFVWKNYEDYAASQHILRVIPDVTKIDPGYLYAFLSSRYGYEQILRYRHGSVIDEVTDKQIEHVLIPCPSRKDQQSIGDKVRNAYEKRAEAIRLEDEAQAILMKELTTAPATKGV